MLRIEGLSLSCPGRRLVTDLSVDLRPGEIWAVLGRNGSGKSTLLGALAALRKPDAGRVTLDCAVLSDMPRRTLGTRVGVMLQEETGEFWGSVRDYVLLGRYPHSRNLFGWSEDDERIAQAAMRDMGVNPLADRPFTALSGGERQRVRAAGLLAQQPVVYLLDEPLQHLDMAHQVLLLERLAVAARGGAIVAVVLHDLNFAARYADHCLMLFGDGAYHAGPAATALSEPRLAALYGHPVRSIDAAGERLLLADTRPGQGPHV